MIEAGGRQDLPGLSQKTHFVVAGAEAGNKLDKAQALGLKILDEEGLTQILSSGGSSRLWESVCAFRGLPPGSPP